MASAIIRRGMATSAAVESAIKHVTVIGGGLMGSGIAQVSVYFFHSTINIEGVYMCAHKLNTHRYVWLSNLLRNRRVHSPFAEAKIKNKSNQNS